MKIINIFRFWFVALLSALLCLGACNRPTTQVRRDLPEILASDTLRVITQYGPISYFMYKDAPMGYEYEFAKHLAEEMGVGLQVLVANSDSQMVAWLEQGKGDLIAWRLPYTRAYKNKVNFAGRSYVSYPVVVQRKSDSLLTDVLDLRGKTIYVQEGTALHRRLLNLNCEIGGGISIQTVGDSLSVDELIALTAHNEITMTVADNELSRLNKTYFGNLDYSLQVGFPQRSGWAVSPQSPALAGYLEKWSEGVRKKLYYSAIYSKYFQRSKFFESAGMTSIAGKRNQISMFDESFRKYAHLVGWDWRLLAAVAYKESHFDPHVVSWAGACGLMQLVPSTAASLGMSEADFYVPELSIKAGALYLAKLAKIFTSVPDSIERIKFVLAAYNAGPGHILDARALAVKYGQDPEQWTGSVESYLRKKTEPEYYEDEVCRFGYCRGDAVVDYVDFILDKYNEYLQRTHP